ncbi:MAG: hypothetical protein OEW15_09210 [Nitrospirota bacterium]|nr:hypothetical protein [Nitrospirota bacterium]
MEKRGRAIVLSLLAGGMAAVLMLPAAFGADTSKGKAVFEAKCLKCHKVDKFKKNRSDRKGWEMTLRRMERNSCILTDEETNAVADYLAKEYGE